MSNPWLRISFWSTPRTVSTACLRAFSERTDCFGLDEPFYAHWLKDSGRQHPLRDVVLAAQECEASAVIQKDLLGPCSSPVQFVKHMCHHLEGVEDQNFLRCPEMRHVFLIRDPREQMASLEEDLGSYPWRDLGYEIQLRLFRDVANPIVLDSRDLLREPEILLRRLCEELGISFQDGMLSWTAGPHPCYGPWASFWYGSVLQSTGFQKHLPKARDLPASLEPLLARALPLHEELRAARLRP